jgi:hypothetical protein
MLRHLFMANMWLPQQIVICFLGKHERELKANFVACAMTINTNTHLLSGESGGRSAQQLSLRVEELILERQLQKVRDARVHGFGAHKGGDRAPIFAVRLERLEQTERVGRRPGRGGWG